MTKAAHASPPDLIRRVCDRASFARLRREGVRVRSDVMWCSVVADSSMSPPQVAFAIGRAVGPAVTRNQLRRRLRAILGAMDVPDGLYLFGGQPSMSELTFAELETRAAALLDAAQHSRAYL